MSVSLPSAAGEHITLESFESGPCFYLVNQRQNVSSPRWLGGRLTREIRIRAALEHLHDVSTSTPSPPPRNNQKLTVSYNVSLIQTNTHPLPCSSAAPSPLAACSRSSTLIAPFASMASHHASPPLALHKLSWPCMVCERARLGF